MTKLEERVEFEMVALMTETLTSLRGRPPATIAIILWDDMKRKGEEIREAEMKRQMKEAEGDVHLIDFDEVPVDDAEGDLETTPEVIGEIDLTVAAPVEIVGEIDLTLGGEQVVDPDLEEAVGGLLDGIIEKSQDAVDVSDDGSITVDIAKLPELSDDETTAVVDLMEEATGLEFQLTEALDATPETVVDLEPDAPIDTPEDRAAVIEQVTAEDEPKTETPAKVVKPKAKRKAKPSTK